MGTQTARAATETPGVAFHINSTNLFLPVFTLPINDKIKFLENIKQGFKITIS